MQGHRPEGVLDLGCDDPTFLYFNLLYSTLMQCACGHTRIGNVPTAAISLGSTRQTFFAHTIIEFSNYSVLLKRSSRIFKSKGFPAHIILLSHGMPGLPVIHIVLWTYHTSSQGALTSGLITFHR